MPDDFNPLSLLAAPVNGLFSWMGAGKQADAAKQAAQTQSEAALRASNLQSTAAGNALEFQKQQSQQDLATQNAIQQGNYNQWAAREKRMSNFGQMLGLAPREIPAYQPLSGASSAAPPASSGGQSPPTAQPPVGNLADPSAWMSLVGNDAALKSWIAQGLGTAAQKPGLVDYYAGVIKKQPGANPQEQSGSAAYYLGKFAADPNNGGASRVPANSPATMFNPSYGAGTIPFVTTPALQAPALNSFTRFLS